VKKSWERTLSNLKKLYFIVKHSPKKKFHFLQEHPNVLYNEGVKVYSSRGKENPSFCLNRDLQDLKINRIFIIVTADL